MSAPIQKQTLVQVCTLSMKSEENTEPRLSLFKIIWNVWFFDVKKTFKVLLETLKAFYKTDSGPCLQCCRWNRRRYEAKISHSTGAGASVVVSSKNFMSQFWFQSVLYIRIYICNSVQHIQRIPMQILGIGGTRPVDYHFLFWNQLASTSFSQNCLVRLSVCCCVMNSTPSWRSRPRGPHKSWLPECPLSRPWRVVVFQFRVG